MVSTWKLDSTSLKFFLKGTVTYERILPYSRDLTCPQPHLVRYLLSQPYRLVALIFINEIFLKTSKYFCSKELVTHVLGLQKPRKDSVATSSRCVGLEQQLVALLYEVMAMTEAGEHAEEILTDIFRNIASDLIYFVLFQVHNIIKITSYNFTIPVCFVPPCNL